MPSDIVATAIDYALTAREETRRHDAKHGDEPTTRDSLCDAPRRAGLFRAPLPLTTFRTGDRPTGLVQQHTIKALPSFAAGGLCRGGSLPVRSRHLLVSDDFKAEIFDHLIIVLRWLTLCR